MLTRLADGGLEALSLAAMIGFFYGFICYGTPLLPRKSLGSFLQVTGTSTLIYSLWRNVDDPSAPFSRMLPVIIWSLAIAGGASVHSFVEFKWSYPDMFSVETEAIAPKQKEVE